MAAIRFRWTVRLENGDYYVDEAIGENSKPMASGPMSREAAIQMGDDRLSDARRRFELLMNEMSGRAAALTHKNNAAAKPKALPRVTAAVPENPSWRCRRRHDAGCRTPS